MKLCTCNNCGNVYEDMNPGKDSIEYPDSAAFNALEKLYEDEGNPESGFWGCPECKDDGALTDNINEAAMDPIDAILVNKEVGNDCNEDQSAQLKGYLRETIPLAGSGDIQRIEKIQLLFPLEYSEALDEMENL